jgi:type II secretory pathway predicted ATPase ExeA
MKPDSENLLPQQLKALWGARAMPFGKQARAPFHWPGFDQALRRLRQAIAIKSSGVLTGQNGAGKSFLLAHCLQELSDKQYALFHLHHTSLTGSDILRALCFQLGEKPRFRRSDTLQLIGQCWDKLEGRFPLLVIDEAQNLTGTALEELRLLGCAHLDTRPLFGLILAGDQDLLPRLQLGINRSLLTRLGFCIELQPLQPEETYAYIQSRLREVSMPGDTFESTACQLLHQGGNGTLRTLNLLARQAIQIAAEQDATKITPEHVHSAIEQLPWFAPPMIHR